MAKMTLKATASNRDYVNCPVCAVVDAGRLPDSGVELVDDSGAALACQVQRQGDQATIHWLIPRIAAGEEQSYTPRKAQSAPSEGVVLTEQEGKIEVKIRGEFFAAYHFDSKWARPFLHPLMGPSGQVTRRYPMETVEGETHDHIHHKGCYVAWGDVNGTDNWSETEGHGRVLHQELLAAESGPVFGRILGLNHWVTNDGKKLMEERREYRFYNQPVSARAFDLKVAFTATEGPVRFGDTKEGGICSVRVATSMDAKENGTITNSFGGSDEAETWGKRAHWCDYIGPVNGEIVGVTIMDNPQNFRHPTYWHVRNYGLMTANPFGLSHFHRGQDCDGSHEIEQDADFVFRYRVFVHAGDTHSAGVGTQYHHYVSPPAVEVE